MADEASPVAGLGSGASAEAMAKAIQGMKSDLAAMVESAKAIATQFNSIAGSAKTAGGAGRGAGNTGAGNPTDMQESLGKITGGKNSALGGAVSFLGKVGAGAISDLTVPTGAAYNHEFAAYTIGGADHSKLTSMIAGAGKFTVTDAGDYANAAAMFTQMGGSSNPNLGTAQLNSALTVGSVSGLSNTSAMQGYQQLTAPTTHYALQAMGVATRDAQGNDLTQQQIFSGIYKRLSGGKRMTEQDVNRGMRQGGPLAASLGASGAGFSPEMQEEFRKFAIAQATHPGQDVGNMSPDEYAKATDFEEGAPGAASQRNRAGAELRRNDRFYEDTMEGAKDVNNNIARVMDAVTKGPGWLQKIFEEINKGRGGYETLNSTDAGKAATSGAGNLLGSLLGSFAGTKVGGKLAAKVLGRAAPAIAGEAIEGAGLGLLGTAALWAPPIAAAGAAAYFGAYKPYKEAKDEINNAEPGAERDAVVKRQMEDLQRSQGIDPNKDAESHWYDFFTGKPKPGSMPIPGGFAKGSWEIEQDQIAQIHKGEMVVPETFADSLRKEIGTAAVTGNGGSSGSRNTQPININLTIGKASDAEAIKFARTVQDIIRGDQELTVIGAGRAADSAYA